MHEYFEGPGAIERWASLKGHEIIYSRVYNKDRFPEIESFDFLIVMGGPQSPSTTKEECPYFDSDKETRFIKEAIDKGRGVLGICLGAQLIGEALGGRFEHSPEREIGGFEISLTKDAFNDPIFSRFPRRFLVGHWHGDMPGLTSGSRILAKSKGCPRQVIRYGELVYGFQCHFEYTSELLESMIKNCGHELEMYKGLPYVQSAEEMKKHDFSLANKLLYRFLDYMENRL
jgi:GMP synthase (glutamine-hydrolysing)